MSYKKNCRDVLGSQKIPKIFGRSLAAPLLILNGFNNIKPTNNGEKLPTQNHYNLVYLMMQKMFPQLDLAKVFFFASNLNSLGQN